MYIVLFAPDAVAFGVELRACGDGGGGRRGSRPMRWSGCILEYVAQTPGDIPMEPHLHRLAVKPAAAAVGLGVAKLQRAQLRRAWHCGVMPGVVPAVMRAGVQHENSVCPFEQDFRDCAMSQPCSGISMWGITVGNGGGAGWLGRCPSTAERGRGRSLGMDYAGHDGSDDDANTIGSGHTHEYKINNNNDSIESSRMRFKPQQAVFSKTWKHALVAASIPAPSPDPLPKYSPSPSYSSPPTYDPEQRYPRSQHIIDMIPPGGLDTFTGNALHATIHSLRDAECARLASVTWEQFCSWQNGAAKDVYSDRGPRELVSMRKLIQFRPHDRNDRGGQGLGDVVVQCMATPYHDAVFECASRELERALSGVLGSRGDSGLVYKASPEIMNLRASPAYPAVAPTMTRMPDGAIYAPQGRFPTVVFEVGFSESAEHLVHDAAVLLHGTGGVTRVAVLVTLTEHDDAPRDDDTAWPRPPRDGSLPRPPAPPPAAAQAETWHQAVRDLADWYLAMDALRRLRPRLVGPLDGHVYVYRASNAAATTAAPAPRRLLSPPLADAGSGIHCTCSTPFIRANTPIPGACFTLSVGEILGASALAGARPGGPTEVVCDLSRIAAYVLSEGGRMSERRALQRAAAAQARILKEVRSGSGGVDGQRSVLKGLVLPNGMVLRDRGGRGTTTGGNRQKENHGRGTLSTKKKSWVAIKRQKVAEAEHEEEEEEEEEVVDGGDKEGDTSKEWDADE
ncbi:hypothetical protein DFH27DRAFT_529226 [Peziza echinospora]|nr:hypothetical protein DFH27DRAFT_529226 [Peziza echinospora]